MRSYQKQTQALRVGGGVRDQGMGAASFIRAGLTPFLTSVDKSHKTDETDENCNIANRSNSKPSNTTTRVGENHFRCSRQSSLRLRRVINLKAVAKRGQKSCQPLICLSVVGK